MAFLLALETSKVAFGWSGNQQFLECWGNNSNNCLQKEICRSVVWSRHFFFSAEIIPERATKPTTQSLTRACFKLVGRHKIYYNPGASQMTFSIRHPNSVLYSIYQNRAATASVFVLSPILLNSLISPLAQHLTKLLHFRRKKPLLMEEFTTLCSIWAIFSGEGSGFINVTPQIL